MKKQYIEFKKQRDFSAILTDTFGFIRNEFKPLMKTVFNIAGPFILIYLLSAVVYSYVYGDTFQINGLGRAELNASNIVLMLLVFFIYIIAFIVAFVFSAESVLYYIKSYINNKGEVDFIEVKKNSYKSFWAFFGLGLLKFITLFIAFALCFLPILYAMVPMAVVFSLYVFEPRNSVFDAYGKGYNLVNVDFLKTLGSYVVLLILFFTIVGVFSLPSSIYAIIKTGLFSGEVDPANLQDFGKDPIIIILSLLQAFFQIMSNTILVIGGVFLYFNLNEKSNFTGTYERINEIGKTEE